MPKKLTCKEFSERIKEKYGDNDIPMLIIPFYEIENIDRILMDFINSNTG